MYGLFITTIFRMYQNHSELFFPFIKCYNFNIIVQHFMFRFSILFTKVLSISSVTLNLNIKTGNESCICSYEEFLKTLLKGRGFHSPLSHQTHQMSMGSCRLCCESFLFSARLYIFRILSHFKSSWYTFELLMVSWVEQILFEAYK